MSGGRPFDPTLLDVLERSIRAWSGSVFRQVVGTTDVLRANIRGARWNRPETEAIYCSIQRRTATAEVNYMVTRQPVPVTMDRITYELDVRLTKVADLRDVTLLEPCGIDAEQLVSDDWRTTRLIGGAVVWLGCSGLIVPSARVRGENLVIFVNNMTANDAVETVSQSRFTEDDDRRS